jgi:hypothetical protein
MTVEGNKILFYQLVAGNDVIIKSDSRQHADIIVTVIRKTASIAYQYKEHIKQKLMMG